MFSIGSGGFSHWYLHKFRLSGIPPPAGGGWFNPDLRAQQRKTRVGIEPSTTCRWWDSGMFSISCRLGLNDPPAPAGGIRLNIICVDTNGWNHLDRGIKTSPSPGGATDQSSGLSPLRG